MTPADLFANNAKHVRAMAKRTHSQELHRYGVEVEDLEQVGLAALWRAAQTFDPSLGFVFATHSLKRVKGAMLDLVRGVRGRWRRLVLPQLRATFDDLPTGEDRVAEVDDADDLDWLRRSVDALPGKLAETLRGKLSGDTDLAISQRIGITAAGVQQRKATGIRLIQERLARVG